jgi:hypothetical protein
MEVFKIKISPEVLRNDLTPESYSGVSFGYYSGLSYVLSAGTTDLGNWNIGTSGNLQGNLGGASILSPLGPNTTNIFINDFDSSGYNWKSYVLNIKIGSLINITTDSGELYQFRTTLPTSDVGVMQSLRIPVESVNVTSIIPIGISVNLTIIQPNSSQLIDLSIPVLLKQNFEDIGYYSPFDGYISQCDNNINFLLVVGVNNNQVCLYNTTPNKTFLNGMEYTVDWGDGSPIENVTLSICHDYLIDGNYSVSFNGVNDFGNFTTIKIITIPFTTSVYTNPNGEVGFITNNGSWSGTPTLQLYNYFFDADNTIAGQVSSNFTSVPFIISGQTSSRINELIQYGPNQLVDGRIVTLEDGTTGFTNSQSEQFTAYTINDVLYVDFSGGTSIFYSYSYGLTTDNIVASAMTKYEYLMNVITQPEIQTYVFIERGKNSGVEDFRRIGEISNTGDLTDYGYGFFDVRNYDDI